ncbi:MAG TPA: hypothetical protein VHV77_16920 [Pirellulales bacterium]|nr:hypothetical protein [Pirellulales bacterium]
MATHLFNQQAIVHQTENPHQISDRALSRYGIGNACVRHPCLMKREEITALCHDDAVFGKSELQMLFVAG